MATAITGIVQKVEVAKVHPKGDYVDMFVYLENDVVEFHHYLRAKLQFSEGDRVIIGGRRQKSGVFFGFMYKNKTKQITTQPFYKYQSFILLLVTALLWFEPIYETVIFKGKAITEIFSGSGGGISLAIFLIGLITFIGGVLKLTSYIYSRKCLKAIEEFESKEHTS